MRDIKAKIQEIEYRRQKDKDTGNGIYETKGQRYRTWGIGTQMTKIQEMGYKRQKGKDIENVLKETKGQRYRK